MDGEGLRVAIKDFVKKGDLQVLTVRTVIQHLESKYGQTILGDSKREEFVIAETSAFVEKWKAKLKRKNQYICSECGMKRPREKADNAEKEIEPKIGFVVIGYGSAGQIRARDAQTLPHVDFRGVVSRRQLGGVKQIEMEAVWKDPSIHAVAVCTENNRHASIVREALNNNKHVLVEYPLCFSHEEAVELFALAEEKQLVLWVELIGILTRPHLKLKEAIQRKRETIERKKEKEEGQDRVVVRFTGGVSKDIQFDEETGEPDFGVCGIPSLYGIMRLHRITDIFGRLELKSAVMKIRKHEGFTLEAEMETLDTINKVSTLWIEERTKGGRRATAFECQFSDGDNMKEVLTREWEPHGSFAVDMCKFLHAVQGEKETMQQHYNSPTWVCHCTNIAEQIGMVWKKEFV